MAVTNSGATAQSNQRHLVALSTGRKVIGYSDTGTNAKFIYSDTGVTWTDYGSDIAGWNTGSISSYVDSGGIERLIVAWKQSGTGGGRSDQFFYAMVGTFDSGRTTLTWGTAQSLGNAGNLDYIDAVTIADGTGGQLFMVMSYTSGSVNCANYMRIPINSSGVFGAKSADGLSALGIDTWGYLKTASYGVAAHTFPSIEVNPITKDLYASWSAGVSGAGKGIRFCKATYSAGTWAWGTEREIDSTRYTNQTNYITTTAFDGTRVLIGGLLLDGIDLMLYERDAADTTTTVRTLALSGSVRPHSTSITYDPDGNVYFMGRGGSAPFDLIVYKWVRSTGLLVNLGPTDNNVQQGGSFKRGYSNGLIEWVYTQGNQSPYQVKYDYIQLNNPQVGLTMPAAGANTNLNAGATFTWSYYAPDAAVQTGWAFKRIRTADSYVEYWNDATTSWQAAEVYNSGTATSVTFGSGKWPVGGSYQWTVGVQNATGVSGYAPAFTVADSGSVSGITVKVGSFTMPSVTGFQTVTGTGVDLSNAAQGTYAIMFWTAGALTTTPGTWVNHLFPSIGFTAGPSNSYSVAAASANNVATSDTARRMAAKAITTVSNNTNTIAEADLVSVGNGQFTLNWTSSDGTPNMTIMYMIVSGLTGAKVVDWTTPTATGNKSVTGLGFSPDMVLHASAGHAASIPFSTTTSAFTFGAMNKHGQQWSSSFISDDNVNPSNTSRWQQTDACLSIVSSTESAWSEAKYASMDSDGFTINQAVAPGFATRVISLGLKGVSSKVGAFVKGASVTSQTVATRHGFALRGMLFAGVMDVPESVPLAYAKLTMGGYDLTNARSAAILDRDNVTPTEAKSIWSNSQVIIGGHNGATVYTASVASTSTSDFGLTWNTSTVNNEEYLYLLLGDSGTSTTPDFVGSSTNSSATAYSNQKKLTVLSTGRKVMAYAETTTNAKFKYSDDGVTWTDYSADIAGWINGSIYAYVDGGGTERLVAVWKQSGTGGSRTDGRVYVMCGSFNSSRTVLSWGSAAEPWGAGAFTTLANYPDVVAHAEGGATGGYCHVALSYSSPSEVRRYIQSSPITDNTIGAVTVGGASTSYGTSGNVYPSIDINPTTKDLYTAWSGVTTGSGQGIRFSKDTYSGGTWTRGSEVEVDTTHYVFAVTYGLVCRWDGTRAVIGGYLYTGSVNKLAVWDSTNFTSFTNRIDITEGDAVGLYGFGMAVDLGAGDCYLFGSQYTGNNVNATYYKATRSGTSLSLGSLVVTDAFVFAIANFPYISAQYTNGRIEWVYTTGNNSPYAVKYDYLQLNRTPAVTLTSPADNFSVNLNTTAQNFAWTVSDADGDTQAKYVFRRRKPNASTYEYWTGSAWTSTLTEVTSTTNNVTITANTWAGSQSWLWSVGVRDTSAASPIGYSTERTITNSAASTSVGVYVGSFTKATVTGNQTVTMTGGPDLSSAAAGTWAIMFWWEGSNLGSGSWQGNIYNGVGFTTGASNSYSVTGFSAAGTTGRRTAAKCINVYDRINTTVTEADFVSAGNAQFVVNWTSQNVARNNHNVHYMVLSGLNNAKVVPWDTPAGVSGGVKSVTGVGFQPDLVLHAMGIAASTLPAAAVNSYVAIGAMNKHGQQWFNATLSLNGLNTNTSRWQQTDAAIGWVDTNEDPSGQAHFQSMDSDGFTMNWSAADAGAYVNAGISLCIKGVSSKLSNFSAGTATQAVNARTGFTPKGVLFVGDTYATYTAPQSFNMQYIGASDGTRNIVSAFYDYDNLGTAQANSVFRTDAAIFLPESANADRGYGSVTLNASTSHEDGGFTVSWINRGLYFPDVLYLAIGDPVSTLAATYVASSAVSTATALAPQRKLARFSTGRILTHYNSSSTNSRFSYSDDGLTWTDMNSDIATFSNGSVFIDQDDYVHVAYKKSSDNFLWYRRGTPNASKTAISWSSDVAVGSQNASQYQYPDVIAHRDPLGNGWWAHVVYSYYDGTNTYGSYHNVFSIYPNGTITAVTGTVTGGPYLTTTTWGFPSIDFNHTGDGKSLGNNLPHLYLAWSGAKSGSGYGIRYKKAAYYNSVWTWGTEREIDSTTYVDVAYGLACRWDAYNNQVMIGVHGFATGTGEVIKLYQRDSADTTTIVYALKNPIANSNERLYGFGFALDATGNAYLLGKRRDPNSLSCFLHYYKWTRTSATTGTLGSSVLLDGLHADSAGYGMVYANSANGKVEYVYTHGDNNPFAVKYDYVVTNAAPVVSQVLPENGARIDLVNNSQNFSWTFTDSESNTQSAYIFRRRRDGFTSYEYWTGSAWTTTYTEVATSTQNVTIAAGKWSAGKNYYWSVGVKDSSGSIGYSVERLLTNTAATVGVYVGSFTKQAAAGNQDITIPVDLTAADSGSWAVIFWGIGFYAGAPVSGTWLSHLTTSLGFVANGGGSLSQYAMGVSSVDGVATANSSRRMAAACITINDSNDAAYAEASFVSFPASSSMRINWSLNGGGNSGAINYLLLTGLSGAKAIDWVEPASAAAKSVTGVGFSPDIVFHAANQAVLGAESLPQSRTHALWSFGAMNRYGQQWSNSFVSNDNVGSSQTGAGQQTDSCLYGVYYGPAVYWEAHFRSMDSDGFTVMYSTVATNQVRIISLALKGVSSRLGAFSKLTTTGAQTISWGNQAFTPRGLLMTSIGRAATAPTTSALWELGVTDGTNTRSVALADPAGQNPTNADSVWSSTNLFGRGANGPGAQSYQYAGTLTSYDSSNFTINVATSDSNGTEMLYMMLGDAANASLPATIGTSTTSAATAYGNQKKLTKLSTGRLVAVYADTATNAKFKYSDDGATWVDMQADIAGWDNGSIDSYTDSGGTRRIVVVWKQNGTGGGRTDDYYYTAVGTLNAGATGITWGTPTNLAGSTALQAGYDFPDVVAFADGAGGQAAYVISFNRGFQASTQSYTAYQRLPIDSTGAFGTFSYDGLVDFSGSDNWGVLGGDYATTSWSFPSITYNPSTKDLYVAWSAGGTGAGKGIRFRKATYSSGVWTWGTELEVDNTRYIESAINQRWLKCVYDGTSVIIAGSLLGSSKTDVVFYERDAADTTTTTRFLFDNNAGATWYAEYGSFGVDADRNIHFVAADRSGNLVYWKWTRATATLSTVSTLDSLTVTGVGHASVLYSNNLVHYVYTASNNSPYAVKYNYIATVTEDTDKKINRWGIIPI